MPDSQLNIDHVAELKTHLRNVETSIMTNIDEVDDVLQTLLAGRIKEYVH